MKSTLKATAVAAVSLAAVGFQANAATATNEYISSGSATLTFTADFASYFLGTNWADDADGNPSSTATVRPTELDSTGTPTDSGSQLTEDGATLSLRSRGVYIYPTDAAGEELSSFADVKTFSFREDDPSVTDEMKQINYVPTGTAGEYTDIETGAVHTLTTEQEALLQDGTLRLCCRHTLGSFEINTAEGYLDGVIDNIAERDINFDGVIDELDDFVLFNLEETSEEGIFDLVLSDVLATYLNYGFTPGAFLDGQPLEDDWGWDLATNGLLNFAGGETVGTLAYSYTTSVASPIPVPAALPLLAGGLGLMGYVGTRRKRAAA